MIFKNFIPIALLFLSIMQSCKQPAYKAPADALFIKILPRQSGINFTNTITDDSSFNEFTYRNFYNGGGVAIGDINNDGLPDVFMTANQLPDKLFLNKGNFKFEDITAAAGIIKKHKWSTGVTMADINADGLLDIYICTAGEVQGDLRKNELYINQGNLTFKEVAHQYNLQDSGAYHTQASFFDFDLDGDLDVYLLNNNGTVPVNNFPNGDVRKFRDKIYGNKLLRNDNGTFTDVTDEAGIYGASIGFGLGIATADINGDNWPDMYISNDFFEKDYLYINQRNGTFKEIGDSVMGHQSQSSMGADMADINNDGLIDIFSTDMLPEEDYRLKKNTRFDDYDVYIQKKEKGLHNQLLGNMLHLNNGNSGFSEIAQYAGTNATDWSWGALVYDMDNDGWKDIVVCNGMYLDVTDQDYIDFVADDANSRLFSKTKADAKYEQLKAMLISKPLPNYAFVNQKNLLFKNQSEVLGLAEPGFSNGAAYADLDNDGDLDLIVNNLNQESFVYRNNTTEKYKKNYLTIALKGDNANTFGIGASVKIYAGGLQQTFQNFPCRGFQSTVEPLIHVGLDNFSNIDSLEVIWPDFKMQRLKNIPVNKKIELRQANAKGKFIPFISSIPPLFQEVSATVVTGNTRHKENTYSDFDRERLMPHLLSAEGPKLISGDINGDKLEDFIVGGAKNDTTKVFLQNRNGTFSRLLPQPSLSADAVCEDAGITLFDADNDGDLDLLITSGGNLDEEGSQLLKPRLYKNNGKGFFEKDGTSLPNIAVNASCVKPCDYDNDGDMDVFIGGRAVVGKYGISPHAYLLQNNKGVFKDVTNEFAPALQTIGMVTDALWQDLDSDDYPELVLVGEWMPITIFKNNANYLQPSPLNEQFKKTAGWWNCIKSADIDNDGDVDFVVGNLGLNSKFKADSLHPAKLFMNDFDKNGTAEAVMAYYKADGKLYPYYLKGDLTAQLPMLKKKFLKYADYAGKTMEEVFDKSQLKDAVVKEAFQFATCIIVNEGSSKFHVQPLPARAQFAPVFAILIEDFNGDGKKDIYLAGNDVGFKPEVGRCDANLGTLLVNDGKIFNYLPLNKSGLMYQGQVRDMLSLYTADKKRTIIIGVNDRPLQFYKK